jgi:hypothetical protein
MKNVYLIYAKYLLFKFPELFYSKKRKQRKIKEAEIARSIERVKKLKELHYQLKFPSF